MAKICGGNSPNAAFLYFLTKSMVYNGKLLYGLTDTKILPV